MSSPSPGASLEVPFTPRKEFVKDQSIQPSSFALLALSSANCIRLYSFTPQAVAALRRLFEQSIILSFREDAAQNLLEFSLDAKPWSNPKSVPTEKLLVDIIAIVYQSGYQYLSTIDYGRETDDRLAMAFSRPAQHQRAPTSIPPSLVPKPEASNTSLVEKLRVKRVPFAISFSSVTVMRVIAPPLHITPAILQAVRGSWPRGVVAEKKVGENSYQFKLKGYKWFQQDTFASDSLQHILSLLTSLDAQSFTLLTSISLTNRSRVKDLWIFTGPAPEDSSDISPPFPTPTGSYGDLSLIPGLQTQHRRLATDPSPNVPHSPTFQHARAATESPRPRFPPPPSGLLRKPAPRAQIPVSVARDSYTPEEQALYRAHMPSTISAGIENMTGVGANPNVIHSTLPYDAVGDFPRTSIPTIPSPTFRGSPGHSPPYLNVGSDRVKTPPVLAGSTSSAPSSPQKSTPPPTDFRHDRPSTADGDLGSKSPPLLGIGTFRDSAFSSHSEISCEIPIKWTGPLKEEMKADQERARSKLQQSNSPILPGGWQATPIDERTEDNTLNSASEKTTTPIHEMLSRIQSPEVVPPDGGLRKSEAALVGIIQSTSPMLPMPQRQGSLRNESKSSIPSAGQGQGWVLINVENSHNSAFPEPIQSAGPSMTSESVTHSNNHSLAHSNIPPPSVASPSAKAIAIIDAMDSKHKKSRSTAIAKESREGGSGVRRFFSLNKKNSRKVLGDDALRGDNIERADGDKLASTSIPRSNLRDKLRRIGTPEAARREDKRRSID